MGTNFYEIWINLWNLLNGNAFENVVFNNDAQMMFSLKCIIKYVLHVALDNVLYS